MPIITELFSQGPQLYTSQPLRPSAVWAMDRAASISLSCADTAVPSHNLAPTLKLRHAGTLLP